MRCSVVFGVKLRLLVINTSSSSPAINKLRQLLPAISVTTCGTVVRRRRVDNTWPVAALTARSETRYRLRIAISTYPTSPPAFHAPGGGGSRRNIAMTFGMDKLEWLDYPTVKNVEIIVIRFNRMYERDRQTDRRTPHDG